jgi:uncharacterized membrane protein
VARILLAVLFVIAGVLHFAFTPVYVRIMPPYVPSPVLLVQISGVFEILGGAGLLVPSTRRMASWGLVALLSAVLPANIQMALNHAHWPTIPVWLLWARVPLQAPLIYWAWLYTRTRYRPS